jgi:tetratricopeptide (TPR) repeat protein
MRIRRGMVAVLVSLVALGAGCGGGTSGEPGKPTSGEGRGETARREVGEPLEEGYKSPRSAGAPFALTASDGTGLRLASMRARAVVDDPLALTELRLTFENPEDRTLEGTFRITLPPGAAVSRFAMRIGDRWQEGEVVEKQAARRAYEDFLHRKQDPALLEQAAGNEFSARVFPIPARGRKELIISYSQELKGDEPYAIPLKGLPEIEETDLAAYLPGGAEPVHALKVGRHAPLADFGFRPGPRPPAALRSGDLAVARIRPVSETRPEPLTSLLVLFDTSASRALGFDAQVETLRALVADVAAREGASSPVAVLCFDQGTELVYEGTAGGFGEAEVAAIKKRGALGASDLEAALKAAGERAAATGLKRVLVVGDGVATAGDAVGEKLGAAALGLKAAGVERIDALVVGGIRDESMLARAARAGLARDGAVIEGDAEVAEIGRRLRAATRSAELKVEGASWQYPRSLAGVQAGDDVLVYAELPRGVPLTVSVDGDPQRLAEPHEVEPALLRRAWARAKIASLLDEQKREGAQEGLAKQIVDLSVKHRVLSPLTALLVLETEQDYARFHLDRTALADILTVENGRVEVVDRSPAARRANRHALPIEQKPADKPGDAPSEGAKAKGGGPPDALKKDAAPAALEAPRPSPTSAPKAAAMPMPAPASAPASADDETSIAAGPALRGDSAPPAARSSMSRMMSRRGDGPGDAFEHGRPTFTNPYSGKFRELMALVAARRVGPALDFALAWRQQSPGDVMALVALGTAYEAAGELESAGRAYGSIIDLYPARADLRRFAGARLEHLAESKGLPLAVDAFEKAVEQRPDHPSSHRLLAFALAKRGDYARALDAIVAGAKRSYPEGRFAGVKRILREDAGLIGAAFARAEPERRAEIEAKLREARAAIERGPSLRFVLNWETDANDVDFHIYDAEGGHAYYSSPTLPDGSELYADVTTGYGPECFTVRKSRGARSSLYTLQAHYYSRGPMGYGMGKLEVIEHDGQGGLSFDERPFVVMVDGAYVNLGTVGRSTLDQGTLVAARK